MSGIEHLEKLKSEDLSMGIMLCSSCSSAVRVTKENEEFKSIQKAFDEGSISEEDFETFYNGLLEEDSKEVLFSSSAVLIGMMILLKDSEWHISKKMVLDIVFEKTQFTTCPLSKGAAYHMLHYKLKKVENIEYLIDFLDKCASHNIYLRDSRESEPIFSYIMRVYLYARQFKIVDWEGITNVAVIASSTGRNNFKVLIDAKRKGKLAHADIQMLYTSMRPNECPCAMLAENNRIPVQNSYYSVPQFDENQEKCEKQEADHMMKKFEEENIELIVLTDPNQTLHPDVLEKYKGRILTTSPELVSSDEAGYSAMLIGEDTQEVLFEEKLNLNPDAPEGLVKYALNTLGFKTIVDALELATNPDKAPITMINCETMAKC